MEVGELAWPFSDVLNRKRAKLASNPKERALPVKGADYLHKQGILPSIAPKRCFPMCSSLEGRCRREQVTCLSPLSSGKRGRDCRGQYLSVQRDIKSFNQTQGL